MLSSEKGNGVYKNLLHPSNAHADPSSGGYITKAQSGQPGDQISAENIKMAVVSDVIQE